MAKKSGSKSSRSERNAGRKRAERARQHGLPVRQQPPTRERAATPEPSDDSYGAARSSDAPVSNAKKPPAIPTVVKVVGGALVILLGVYLLSRQRDSGLTETRPAAEPAAATSAAEPAAPSVGPELVPALEPSAGALRPAAAPAGERPGDVVSVAPPAKPLVTTPAVAAPVVAPPNEPKVDKPVVTAAAAPKPVAAPAAPAPVIVPTSPATPKPAAPKPPATPPADNPY